MLSFFGSNKASPEAAAQAGGGSRAVHDAISGGLADIEAFHAHVVQMGEELKRVQKGQQAEREAAQREKHELEAKWLQRLRMVRVESALRAGFAARDLRAAGRTLKLWAEVVGLMRRESLAQRQQREQSLQLKLRDSGRAEVLAERASLGQQAAASALAAQQLRGTLSARSLELERTIVRDTMAFELWAADALRTKKALEEVGRQREEAASAHEAQADSLRETVARTAAEGVDARDKAEAAVAATMGSELAACERASRVRAASQAVVVRLAVQHSVLHRYWRTWASVASLLLREAGGALLQLELSKQQQRGVHTRLQAELSSELAVARVENLEARVQLAKAGALEQLKPGHELATDKELLREQSRALHAAHESAAAAHLAAAAHRVGEETLAAELRSSELLVNEAAASMLARGHRGGRANSPTRSPLDAQLADDARQYDRSTLDFLEQQEQHNAAALRRAGCELRVLVRSLHSLESEWAAAPAAPAAKAAAKAAAKPRDASPGQARPPPASKPVARPPRAKPAPK